MKGKKFEQCTICMEDIVYYAIGECGHNMICWNCTLRQRIKMHDETCPYCKKINIKMLITSNKEDSLEKNTQAICDTEYELYFEDVTCKNFV